MMTNKEQCETKTDTQTIQIPYIKSQLYFLILVHITDLFCRIKMYLNDIISSLY